MELFDFALQDRKISIRVYGDPENPLFCGKDTAAALGYKDTDAAIRKHINEKYKIKLELAVKPEEALKLTHNQLQQIYITEPGLYSLIFRSKLESAHVFTSWIAEQVLPSIRKKGKYEHQMVLKELEDNYNKLMKKHETLLLKHKYHKFRKTGPCFYVIDSGLDYKDGVSRIKIGITGTGKKKNIDVKEASDSIDNRLAAHRTLWPQLKVRYIVYTPHAELLEKYIKIMMSSHINPHGHEIIHEIALDEIISNVRDTLQLLNKYNNASYSLESDIEVYNNNSIHPIKAKIVFIDDEVKACDDLLIESPSESKSDISSDSYTSDATTITSTITSSETSSEPSSCKKSTTTKPSGCKKSTTTSTATSTATSTTTTQSCHKKSPIISPTPSPVLEEIKTPSLSLLPINQYSINELKTLLESRDLSEIGSKTILYNRLSQYIIANETAYMKVPKGQHIPRNLRDTHSKCSKCLYVKPKECFNRDSTRGSGVSALCKEPCLRLKRAERNA